MKTLITMNFEFNYKKEDYRIIVNINVDEHSIIKISELEKSYIKLIAFKYNLPEHFIKQVWYDTSENCKAKIIEWDL